MEEPSRHSGAYDNKVKYTLGLKHRTVAQEGSHARLAAPAPEVSYEFEYRNYACRAFQSLRERHGIGNEDFAQSVAAGCLSGGQVGEGKSGMLFYFTKDKRYLLKTVKESEKNFFFHQGILQAYIEHMEAYPDTLMCRFYGLYKIRMMDPGEKKKGKKKGKKNRNPWMVIIVMANTFETPLALHERYDLKGSTRNRLVKDEDIKSATSVLKDLNFKSKIYVDSVDAEALRAQLRIDTLWLIKHGIMDYSLLLGVHKCLPQGDGERALAIAANSPEAQAAAARPGVSRWMRDLGGIEGRTPSGCGEVYLMCVIDTLQVYDMGKKMENMIKRRTHDQIAISSVDPKAYGERAHCSVHVQRL